MNLFTSNKPQVYSLFIVYYEHLQLPVKFPSFLYNVLQGSQYHKYSHMGGGGWWVATEGVLTQNNLNNELA